MGLSIAHGDNLATDPQGSLIDTLMHAIDVFPNGAFTFIDASDAAQTQTYQATLQRALRIATGLRRNEVRAGDRAIIALEQPEDFIAGLWACLLSGLLAVPLSGRSLITSASGSRSARMAALLDRLEAPWIITRDLPAAPDIGPIPLRHLQIEELESYEPSNRSVRDEDGLGVLIPTSGTTGRPNLVRLDARALLHRWWPQMPDRNHAVAFLSWAPLDHVMGLSIASPNLPRKVHLSPSHFAASPTSWLDAVERFEISHATMTTFGLGLILRALEAVPERTWSMGSLRKLGIGAEAISSDLCERLLTEAKRFGLRDDVIILGYGLTECGPVAGGGRPFVPEKRPETGPHVRLDRPTPGHAIRIVGERDDILPEDAVGAVQVRGLTMASGYFGDPEGTARLFTSDGWIRTGDLGFLSNGHLTVTGREKETLSFHAKKVACAEVEAVACSVPEVQAAYAVACRPRPGLASPGEQRVGLFFEASTANPDATARCIRALRAATGRRFGVAPAYMMPIEPADVPRTPNGKVQRLQLAERLDSGTFDAALAEIAASVRATPPDDGAPCRARAEVLVATAWQRSALGHADFTLDDDFFAVGGGTR